MDNHKQDKTEEYFSHHEVARILNIKKDRLRGWLNEGFVKPSIPSAGRGKANLYTRHDLYAIGLFMSLIDTGYSREFARSAAEIWLRKIEGIDAHTIVKLAIMRTQDNQEYVRVDEFTFLVPYDFTFDPDRELNVLLANTGGEWTRYEVINLEGIMRKIDEAIGKT